MDCVDAAALGNDRESTKHTDRRREERKVENRESGERENNQFVAPSESKWRRSQGPDTPENCTDILVGIGT